jgi:hypothetical protein
MRTKGESETPATRDEVARLAQQIWEREGRQAGRDLEYWLQAEQELIGRRNLASPTRSRPATAARVPSQRARKPIRLPDSTTKPVYTR